MLKTKLTAFAYFGRVGMAPLTMSVPILGAFTLGMPLPLIESLSLGFIGLCAHVFGFGLNDLIDLPLDRTVPERQRHPLATGQLRQWEAWGFVLAQVPLALGLYCLLGGTGFGLSMLGVSIGLSVIYNLWSKQGHVSRFLPELALALSIGLLCVSGAALKTGQIPVRSLLYAVALTLVLLLLNSVASGLKDLKTDAAFGATSFVLSTGSRMLDADRILITRPLQVYSVVLHSLILVCLLFLLGLFEAAWPVSVLVCVLSLYAALHLRMLLTLRSFTTVRRSMPLLNGYYNYAALALMVIGQMPTGLRVLYGVLILSLLIIPWRLSWQIAHDQTLLN